MSRRRQRWLWGAASHLGGRHEQQDRWGVFTTPDQDGLLAVVADGLGGHQDGALGAQAVIDASQQFIQAKAQLLRVNPTDALVSLAEQLQDAVATASARAHSTVVTVWLYQGWAYWMHIGDSRLYHLRAGRRLLRTRDHSAAQMLLDLGEISEAEIAHHPAQSRLYRALGSGMSAKPEIGSGLLTADDLLVLCSDGVWEHVSETELWESACSGKLNVLANALVAQAAERGGAKADNATVVLIQPLPEQASAWFWLRRFVEKSWSARLPRG